MKRWIGAILPLAVSPSTAVPVMAADATSPDPLPAVNAASPYPLTERNKADIIRQLKDKLGHGETALWRWPLHQRKYGLYCGWVNAQNYFGDYTGWKPFVVVGGVISTGEFTVDVSAIVSGGPSKKPDYIVANLCPKYGYDLSGPPSE
jgi:hypothetical protein